MGTWTRLAALVWLTLILGCTGAQPAPPEVTTDPAPAVAPSGAPGIIGVWQLSLGGTPAAPSASVTPLRDLSNLGSDYLLDASRYFNGQFCGDCLKLTGVGLTAENNLDLVLRAKHPFAMPTPPLALNQRADLDIFDVGLMLVGGSSAQQFPDFGKGSSALTLLNADGYSGALDPVLERLLATPNVDIHPYRLFNVDPTEGNFAAGNFNGFADVFAPSGHNVFPQGAVAEEHFIVRPPATDPTLRFAQDYLLVLTASWGQGSNNQKGSAYGQRGNPIYFLPEFNQKAAWRVTTSLSNNGLQGGVASSTADVAIDVWDWQWGAPVDPGYPDLAHVEQVRVASEPLTIRLVVPGVLANAVNIDPTAGSGNHRTFPTQITNELSAATGTYLGAVEVVDSIPDASGIAQDDPIPFTLGQLATYALFEVTVAGGTGSGEFGSAERITDRDLQDVEGHANFNAPDLVAIDNNLFLAYQSLTDEAVVARKIGNGAWENVEVHQGDTGDFLDPVVGGVTGTSAVHCLLALPGVTDPSQQASLSDNSGATWGSLLPIVEDAGSIDETHCLSVADVDPLMGYGVITISPSSVVALELLVAAFDGAGWNLGGSISVLKPHSGGLVRIDEAPMVFHLDSGTWVAVFGSNERAITQQSDDFPGEPIAARSLDGGDTWQDWTHLHNYVTDQLYERLSSASNGTTVYCLESLPDPTYQANLYQSDTEGVSWSKITLPTQLNDVLGGIAEVACGPDNQLAVVFSPLTAGPNALVAFESANGGQSWGSAQVCDDDPDELYDEIGLSVAYTADGALHVAFSDDRSGSV
ncbi:MAG: sialidase family protein, partial [bacterium]